MRYKITQEEFNRIEELVDAALSAPNKQEARRHTQQMNFMAPDLGGGANNILHELKTLDEQSDTDMIFAKMPTEKEISTNETLNTSLSPVRIFITILTGTKKMNGSSNWQQSSVES